MLALTLTASGKATFGERAFTYTERNPDPEYIEFFAKIPLPLAEAGNEYIVEQRFRIEYLEGRGRISQEDADARLSDLEGVAELEKYEREVLGLSERDVVFVREVDPYAREVDIDSLFDELSAFPYVAAFQKNSTVFAPTTHTSVETKSESSPEPL